MFKRLFIRNPIALRAIQHALLLSCLIIIGSVAMEQPQWVKVEPIKQNIEIVKDIYRFQDGYEELNMQAKDPLSKISFKELEKKYEYYIIGVTTTKELSSGKAQHNYYDGFNLVFHLLEGKIEPQDPTTKTPIQELTFFYFKKNLEDEIHKKYKRFERFISLPCGTNSEKILTEDSWRIALKKAFGLKGVGHFNGEYFDYNEDSEHYEMLETAHTAQIGNFAFYAFEDLYTKAKTDENASPLQRASDAAMASYMIASILEGRGNIEEAIYWYNSIDPHEEKTCYKAGAEKRIQDIENNASKDNKLPWHTLQGKVERNNFILGEGSRIVDNQLQLNASIPVNFNPNQTFVDAIKEAENKKLPYFLMVARTESYGKSFYHFYDMQESLPTIMYKKKAEDMTLNLSNDNIKGFDSVKLISLNFYVKPHNENTFYSFIITDQYIAVHDENAFEKFKKYVISEAKFVVLASLEWKWNKEIYGEPQKAQLKVAEFLQKANNFSGSAAFIKDIEMFKKGWVGTQKKEWEKLFGGIQQEQKKAPLQQPISPKIPIEENDLTPIEQNDLTPSISTLTQKLRNLSQLLIAK